MMGRPSRLRSFVRSSELPAINVVRNVPAEQRVLDVGDRGHPPSAGPLVARRRIRAHVEPRPGVELFGAGGPEQHVSADAERSDQRRCLTAGMSSRPGPRRRTAPTKRPWGMRVSPVLRHQSGQPFGRTFTTRLSQLATIRVLAEPVGTRRMDNVTLVDVRVEKRCRSGTGVSRRSSTSSTASTPTPSRTCLVVGRSFLRPVASSRRGSRGSGLKFDW